MSYQCRPCGRLFAALAGFDAHQSVDYRRKPPVVCTDPESLGMERNKYGRWYFPSDAPSRPWVPRQDAVDPSVHTPGTPRAPGGSEALRGARQ